MIHIEVYSKEQWKAVSDDAHKIAFCELKTPGVDRIDFALVPIRNGIPCGFVTCREHDGDTIYWQFGGAFPGTKDSSLTWQCYGEMVAWSKLRYKRITTLIENTNTVMLKMAMKIGFRIVGVRYYNGIYLEHLLEFPK